MNFMDRFYRNRYRWQSPEGVKKAKENFKKSKPTVGDLIFKVIEEAEIHFASTKPDEGTLTNLLHLYAQIIQLSSKINKIKVGLTSMPPHIDSKLFGSFIDSIRTFDYYLGDLDYTLIELYNPDLAKTIMSAIGCDMNFIWFYNNHIAPQFGLSDEKIPDSLRHYLRDFNGDYGYSNSDIGVLDIELTGQETWDTSIALNNHSINRINELCDILLNCKDKLSTIITTNWSIKEIFENQNNKRKIEIIMGDKFENIHSSTITNRSILIDSFNKIKSEFDEETANALIKISEIITASKNQEAVELFDTFNEELKKKEPKKTVLRTIWNGIKNLVPVLSSMADIGEKIAKIIG